MVRQCLLIMNYLDEMSIHSAADRLYKVAYCELTSQ